MVWLNSHYPIIVDGRIAGIGIAIIDVTQQRGGHVQLDTAPATERRFACYSLV